MITIFKTGEFDYSDLGVNKPVRFTIENLLEIASKTAKSDITHEHSSDVVGVMENFVVDGNELKANEPTNLELKNKGFSPEIIGDLIDYGDYFGIKNVTMPRVGYTENPRTKILYNSIENPNGDNEGMTEDTELRKVLKEKQELQEQIGVLKSHNAQLKKDNKKQKEEIDKFKESDSKFDEKLKNYEALEKKAKSYDELMQSRKDEMIKVIAGDDKTLAERYANFSIEDLETVIETQNISRPPQGITSQQQGDIQGDEDEHGSDDEEYSWEEFEEDFKASGL